MKLRGTLAALGPNLPFPFFGIMCKRDERVYPKVGSSQKTSDEKKGGKGADELVALCGVGRKERDALPH